MGGPPPAELSGEEAADALLRAAEKMKEELGSVDVPYGQVYRVARREGKRTYPVGGGNPGAGMATPRAIGFTGNSDGQFIGRSGQTSTQVVQLTKPPKSWMVLPLGESDHKESGHWDDQAAKLFSKGKLKPTFFMDLDGLKSVTESTRVLRH